MKELKNYLHLYLGCEVMHNIIKEPEKLLGVAYFTDVAQWCVRTDRNIKSKFGLMDAYKPILRPLPSMTEKEEYEITAFCLGSDDYILTYRGMGYSDNGVEIHESVRCCLVETFCEQPMVKNWVPTALLQIDYKDNIHHIVIGKFQHIGKAISDDLIEKPFELTRYLLSKHFDLFGLIEAGLAIDSTTLTPQP